MKRLLTLVLGFIALHVSAIAQSVDQHQIQKLNYAYQQIRNNYVDDVPLEPLVEEAINATLRQLDPHSTYLTREQMTNLRTRLRGKFAGIGIEYIIHNDTPVVWSIIPNSPAERAKLRINDRITRVDSKSIIGVDIDSIPSILQGEVNSKVELEIIRRNADKPLSKSLKRDIIESSAIDAAFTIGNIGYISVSTFSKPVAAEFLTAYQNLGEISSLIVDLRDNGGGAITAAIDLTGLFLRSGDVIVSTEGRANAIVYDKKKDGPLLDIPLVVIINENSASASEIFAGAIQDHDRGVIVGRTSFGKGLVQKVIDFKDGSGMCLTVARYKTPSGRIIQRPYTMGDKEAYTRDTMRYIHPDSIHKDPNMVFKTLKHGRLVYGGGGIIPDIYITRDSTQLSATITTSYYGGAFESCVIDIFDQISVDMLREQYPTVAKFISSYTMDRALTDLLYSRVPYTQDKITSTESEFVERMLIATMAQQLYGKSARHYIYSIYGYDSFIGEALAIASNRERYREILVDRTM